MKDAPLLSEFWKTFILLQNATAGAAVFLWNTNFWHCVDETEASEVHKSLETKQQSQEDFIFFYFVVWSHFSRETEVFNQSPPGITDC